MIGNCTKYGPLLVQLLFHQFTFQQRYIELLKNGHFTFKLRDNDSSAFLGNDAVIEDVNLLAGQFRHKRQTLGQAIDQCNCIDLLQREQKIFDKNLDIKMKAYEHTFKDDLETKLQIIRALLHFGSFKNKNRSLCNEFSTDNNVKLNPERLKKYWYPVANYLIRRFVKNNKSDPMCNLLTVEDTETSPPELTNRLLTKVKKSSSIVINIKNELKHDSSGVKKDTKLKRKAKQIMNQFI